MLRSVRTLQLAKSFPKIFTPSDVKLLPMVAGQHKRGGEGRRGGGVRRRRLRRKRPEEEEGDEEEEDGRR